MSYRGIGAPEIADRLHNSSYLKKHSVDVVIVLMAVIAAAMYIKKEAIERGRHRYLEDLPLIDDTRLLCFSVRSNLFVMRMSI